MIHPCTDGCYLAAIHGPSYRCVGRCVEDDYSGDDPKPQATPDDVLWIPRYIDHPPIQPAKD